MAKRKATKPGTRSKRNGKVKINRGFQAARMARKLSRPELARRAGVSASYVFQLETTSRLPRLDDGRRLAGVLKCSLEVLWPSE